MAQLAHAMTEKAELKNFGAPDEVREYFAVQDDGSFELDALMVEAE